MPEKPNVLFIMTDQQRFDTIAALGASQVYTPNYDRLVRRGMAFTNAYSTCPVCVPARYTIRTGCEPPTTRVFTNARSAGAPGQAETMEGRCGPYLARTMTQRGYRTFGIGKFHTQPWDEDLGYEVHLHTEELFADPDQRARDKYAAFLAAEHPEYAHIEQLHGERTEMYYMPQMSPMPAEVTVEAWVADRAVEQIQQKDQRPYFGLVSFIGPHPPCAPPIPFNRMYDPDRMPNPVRGDIELDHMDEQLPWMNHLIWASDINDSHARVLKARYYGEISYIDQCLGRILDAVEARPDADNTLICFFTDHGDHLGDHHAWQKESYFEASCHIPFLLSWPKQISADSKRDDLVCLTDLFAIATGASGDTECRDGHDVLATIAGETAPRESLVAMYGEPGTPLFKVMVRQGPWKYIFLANGGREQLFNLPDDPQEAQQRLNDEPAIAQQLRQIALAQVDQIGSKDALVDGDFKTFDFEARPLFRIHQFDLSRGVTGFPEHPREVLT